ncbi:MAG: YigZ family protein [Proteobacteria bacterium]|nr:YigZ family protein [Pseudomonadota bacterium]
MFTIAKQHIYAKEIKKSRFIAIALPVDSPEEALHQLEAVGDPEATHNCWAYKVGDQYRFSDDGEPGGTAGKPILAAIEGQNLDCVVVVVTRFFGGIKLGAGGLVRAYGGTAAECLRTAQRMEILRKIVVKVNAPFDSIGAIYPLIEQFSAEKLNESYLDTGIVLTMELEEKYLGPFKTSLADATRGKAILDT